MKKKLTPLPVTIMLVSAIKYKVFSHPKNLNLIQNQRQNIARA